MKFDKEFKATLQSVSLKLDEALAELPDASAIEIDTSKVKLTVDEVSELSLQAVTVRDIFSSLKDANERMKRFIAEVETNV
jgi:hypothetical protein